MYSTISGPMHVFRDRTKGYHMAGESISHFQLFLQDLEFQTHWYPQIASRRTTRGHPNEIDPKKIGRATGRERVFKYVSISVVAAVLKIKNRKNRKLEP